MTGGPLRYEVRIEAPLDIVWRCFTDPARLTEWWPSRATIDPRVRGRLRLEFDKPDAGTDVALGEFVEVSARRIVFTWGFEGDPDLPPGASRVEVTLEPVGAATVVRLEHHGLPAARRAQHEQGWTFFLGRLREAAPREPRPG
ncbi:MAG TPA: SRPBCC domain-containing protein [Candidatus Limnocylindria bacterium]|nr:SRPBCC domain-containing protein [Candidatus Limnocylindria bacterium]